LVRVRVRVRFRFRIRTNPKAKSNYSSFIYCSFQHYSHSFIFGNSMCSISHNTNFVQNFNAIQTEGWVQTKGCVRITLREPAGKPIHVTSASKSLFVENSSSM
jgi:hypothetical protein